MTRIKWFFTLVFTVLFFAACSPPTPKTAEDYLKAGYEVLGGEGSVKTIETLSATARVRGPESIFYVVVHSATNGNVRATWDYGDRTSDLGIRDGTIWYVSSETGEIKEAPTNVEFFIRGHEFHFDALFLDKRFKNLQLVGEEDFRGHRAVALQMTDPLSAKIYAFFDPVSSRFLGLRKFRESEKGQITMDFVYSDWKPVEGMMLPCKVTIYDGEEVYIYEFTEVAINSADAGDFYPTAD